MFEHLVSITNKLQLFLRILKWFYQISNLSQAHADGPWYCKDVRLTHIQLLNNKFLFWSLLSPHKFWALSISALCIYNFVCVCVWHAHMCIPHYRTNCEYPSLLLHAKISVNHFFSMLHLNYSHSSQFSHSTAESHLWINHEWPTVRTGQNGSIFCGHSVTWQTFIVPDSYLGIICQQRQRVQSLCNWYW